MNNFTHRIPTELRFGKDVVSGLPEVLDRYGKNVLLAYGGESIRRIGLYDRVTGLLSENGFRVTELSGIEPNPVIGTVRKGVRLCLDNGIDVILAVGGGSDGAPRVDARLPAGRRDERVRGRGAARALQPAPPLDSRPSRAARPARVPSLDRAR